MLSFKFFKLKSSFISIGPQHVGFEETEGSFASETSEEGSSVSATRTPKRIPKKKKVRKPVSSQEGEEDDEEDVPKKRIYGTYVFPNISIIFSFSSRNSSKQFSPMQNIHICIDIFDGRDTSNFIRTVYH